MTKFGRKYKFHPTPKWVLVLKVIFEWLLFTLAAGTLMVPDAWTWWKYVVSASGSLVVLWNNLKPYFGVGKEEVPRGSNWGEHVKKYLNSVGINFPASWCMAFVFWCAREAAHANDKPAALVNTGGVLAQWNQCNPHLKVLRNPAPGDIFIMDFGKGLGHTGFVEKVEGDILHTIEGNTNDEGSREGYEVCRRLRKTSAIKGYIRIPTTI